MTCSSFSMLHRFEVFGYGNLLKSYAFMRILLRNSEFLPISTRLQEGEYIKHPFDL